MSAARPPEGARNAARHGEDGPVSSGPRLSAVLITKNEAAHIEACLRSLAFADEIVVLDSGSTDGTLELARACGAHVHQSSDWPGFGAQKNRALDLASGDWILSVDADERVDPDLARDIRAAIAGGDTQQAYALSRLSMFCGAYMHHSGWRPDHVTRLFARGQARFSPDQVHERLVLNPGVRLANLKTPLRHLSYSAVDEVLDKMNRYSSARALDLSAKGRRGGLAPALAHGLWAFVRTYLLRLGFLDGRHGFVLAVANAEGTYYRYLKMCPEFNKPRGYEPPR